MATENENYLRKELEAWKQFYKGLEHDLETLKNQYDSQQERMKILNDENEQLRKQNRHLLAKLEEHNLNS
jgi:hypothetical protein